MEAKLIRDDFGDFIRVTIRGESEDIDIDAASELASLIDDLVSEADRKADEDTQSEADGEGWSDLEESWEGDREY